MTRKRSLPITDQTVALLKLPIGVTNLPEVVNALEAAYGPDLVINTQYSKTFMLIEKPESENKK